MRPPACLWALFALVAAADASAASPGDQRLREVAYDPQAVVTIPVKRGIVTLVVLGADEGITEVASGLGADCAKVDAAWCVATQPGGRTLFVKPKTSAKGPNNLAVVTDRRIHNLRFVVLEDDDAKPPVYRLTVKPPQAPAPQRVALQRATLPEPPLLLAEPNPQQVVAHRLQAKPQVMNTQYWLSEGLDSHDIVPTLAFDDGRFTYLRFPGNREVPAVFHVLEDGTETLVNARMEDDLLVVDRISRRLILRAGSAVVGLWNEAFDLEGLAPTDGTTVPGVKRVLKPQVTATAQSSKGAAP